MAEPVSNQSPESVQTERYPDAFLVEWQQNGETWVHAHANEPTAVDQALRKGGTCTPLFRDNGSTALLARVVAWLDRADDSDDDCQYLNGQGGDDGWDDIRAIVADAREALS